MTSRYVRPPAPAFNNSNDSDEENDRPAFGLGAKRSLAESSPAASSPAKDEDVDNEDDEDDYMNMVIAEPVSKETTLQRRERLKREAQIRGRPKSKAELAEEEREKREEALNKSLLDDQSSRGLRMMKAMGFKSGEGLGKALPSTPKDTTDSAESSKPHTPSKVFEPIKPIVKETRSGIGHDTERKRKIMEELQAEGVSVKRQALSPEDYRERVRLESLAKRHEAQFHAAQKVCERFTSGDGDENNGDQKTKVKSGDPTFSEIKATPVLWRGLLHHRALRALDARMRHDLLQSGPLVGNGSGARLPGYVDPEMEEHDKIAIGNEEVALEEEWEDEELNEFEQRDVKERLDEIVKYLRDRWIYCFWCKHKYESEEDLREGCPGLEEEDHD